METRFMTRKEIERERRNSRIVDVYKEMRNEHPDVKPSRLLPEVAKMTGVSGATVWKVLKDRMQYN